jgi:SNF2 family DNA or RNA helicase
MEPNCQNLFCGECLLKWLNNNNTCPLCRNNVNLSELIYIDNNETKIDQQLSSKILLKTEQIIDIIKSNKKGRFLIFSDFEGSFKPICQILNDNNINFLILKGDVLQRTSIIDTYKNNIVNVIFINSSKDCAGINLPETTDIILYHQMSDNNKSQIISRAERIGRTEVLNIHQLLVHI